MIQTVRHYAHAVETRMFLLNELRIMRRKGIVSPLNLWMKTLLQPYHTEDWINFLRFIEPNKAVHLIDVGANTGYWAKEFMQVFPNSRLTAFEPVGATFKELERRFMNRPNVQLKNCALSNEDGSAEINVSLVSTFSSFEEYGNVVKDVRGDHAASSETVQIRTLDGFNLAKCDEVRVLKVDVQGHEEEALLGAVRTLQDTDVMLCEVSFGNEYKGRPPSFSHVCELTRQADLHPIYFQDFTRSVSTYAVERDVLFVKRPLLDKVYDDRKP